MIRILYVLEILNPSTPMEFAMAQVLMKASTPDERKAGEALLAAGVPEATLEGIKARGGNWLKYLKYIPLILELIEKIINDESA